MSGEITDSDGLGEILGNFDVPPGTLKELRTRIPEWRITYDQEAHPAQHVTMQHKRLFGMTFHFVWGPNVESRSVVLAMFKAGRVFSKEARPEDE